MQIPVQALNTLLSAAYPHQRTSPVHPHPRRTLPLSLGSSEGDRCLSWDNCIPIAWHVVCRMIDLNVSEAISWEQSLKFVS